MECKHESEDDFSDGEYLMCGDCGLTVAVWDEAEGWLDCV